MTTTTAEYNPARSAEANGNGNYNAHARSNGTASRVPPHDLDAEVSLLGAMLLSRDAASEALEAVTTSDFYRPAHAAVFDAIGRLSGAGESVDVTTVADVLRRSGELDGVGGTSLLVSLMTATPSTSSVRRYASIVADHALLRRLIGAAGEIAELAYGLPQDVHGALDEAEQHLYRLADARRRGGLSVIGDTLGAWLGRLESLYQRGDSMIGVATGWYDLDQSLLGLQPGQLIGVAARPSMGKTAFALNMAEHAAGIGEPTLVCNLEMSRPELETRLVSQVSRIDHQRLRNGRLHEGDWHKVSSAMTTLGTMPLWIEDDAGASLLSIRAAIRRMVAAAGRIGLVIIDYLQLLTPSRRGENRQVEVAELSRGLKRMALELDVPIVALSQLSRSLESRSDKRPILSDLRESGAIENDCDIVLFLYRDEVYNPDTKDRGVAEVHIAKHRNGPVGTARLAWLQHHGRFANMARV